MLLAGGLGTRLREETEFRPKPMVNIGGKPILWHLMKYFSHFGYDDFIICAGYKSEVIKDYFLNFDYRNSDFTVTLGIRSNIEVHTKETEPWKITIVDTGQETLTGGRIAKIKEYINESVFMVTYGDGLSNVDLDKLLDFHKSHGKIATVTSVQQPSRFGMVESTKDGLVLKFEEKPHSEDWINGGFFVFNSNIFEYLNPEQMLETSTLQYLVSIGELMAFKHHDFWQPMDTYRESEILNRLWEKNIAPWKVWDSR